MKVYINGKYYDRDGSRDYAGDKDRWTGDWKRKTRSEIAHKLKTGFNEYVNSATGKKQACQI